MSRNGLAQMQPVQRDEDNDDEELKVHLNQWWRTTSDKQRGMLTPLNRQEKDAKRVKRKKPEFKVAHDDFAVDIQAFSELAVSKRSSGVSGNAALKDKSNALFLPKGDSAAAKKQQPVPVHLKGPPRADATVSALPAYPPSQSCAPLAPRSPNRERTFFSALQSTPGRNASSSIGLPSPGLGAGIFTRFTGSTFDFTVPTAGTSKSHPKTLTDKHRPRTSSLSSARDGTTSGAEDGDNDGTLAGLMQSSLALEELCRGVLRSSSVSSIPEAPPGRSDRALQDRRSPSEMEGLASVGLPLPKPYLAYVRSEKHTRKKAALNVADSGSLKSRKKSSKETSFSSGGDVGRLSARKKRDSSVLTVKRQEKARPSCSVKGSIIRDIAVRADSSGSADELAI